MEKIKEFIKIGYIIEYKYDTESIYEKLIVDKFDVKRFTESVDSNHIKIISIKDINGNILVNTKKRKLFIYSCVILDNRFKIKRKDFIFSYSLNSEDIYIDGLIQCNKEEYIVKNSITITEYTFNDLIDEDKIKYNNWVDFTKNREEFENNDN